MTTVDYKVIEGESTDGLERKVLSYLEKGWTLQGGVAVFTTSGTRGVFVWYVQAISKNKP